MDDDQDWPSSTAFSRLARLVHRDAAADQGTGDRAAAVAGHLDVLEQVAAAQHRAKAWHGSRLEAAQPVHEKAEAAAIDRVLQVVGAPVSCSSRSASSGERVSTLMSSGSTPLASSARMPSRAS